MAVDTELLDALGTAVDQTQTVGLASLEVKFGEGSAFDARIGLVRGRAASKVHLAVDEVIVGVRSEVRRLGRCQYVCFLELGMRKAYNGQIHGSAHDLVLENVKVVPDRAGQLGSPTKKLHAVAPGGPPE